MRLCVRPFLFRLVRVRKLQKDAEIVGKGNLDYPMATAANDELGELSRSFEQMARNLKTVMASRDELKNEIEDRKRAEEALRESEERHRTLVEAASQSGQGIVLVQDTDLVEAACVFANDTASEMTGCSQNEMAHLSWIDIVHPLYQDVARNRYRRRLSGEIIWDMFEISILSKGGTEIPIELTSTSMESHGKGAQVVFFRDISERKHAEEQIQASLKEKEVLLRELYHRTKNNMQVIIGLLSLQSEKIKQEQFINMFKESQNRIKAMSLDHEKLYQSKDLVNIDFGEYVTSFANSLLASHGISPGKISIKTEIANISFDLENAIPSALVINELVSKSVKYAFPDDRKGEIKITLYPVNEEELELTVSDDGIGIPEALDFDNIETLGLDLTMLIRLTHTRPLPLVRPPT